MSRPMNAPAHTDFMLDHMLIKLGKYLRILGCDAEWDTKARTHELIHRANIEKRVFLSRNRRIPHQYPPPHRMLLVESTDPVQQLHQVVSAFRLHPRGGLFSKCIRCNLALEELKDKSEAQAFVHPNVYTLYDAFYRCPACRTVFWKGSHVRNTCRKLGIRQ